MTSRFFKKSVDFFTVSEILAMFNASEIEHNKSLNMDDKVYNVSALGSGEEGSISFLESPKYSKSLATAKVSYCFVSERNLSLIPSNIKAIVVESPHYAITILGNKFYSESSDILKWNKSSQFDNANVDPSASVAESAKIGQNVTIQQNVVIEPFVEIGDNSIIMANTIISNNVIIGSNTIIRQNATVSHSTIGSRCIIHTGAKIGQDGFGFAFDKMSGKMIKMSQLGSVIIGDDVEIGANTTIDRGAFSDTIISNGVKIDNLVQIAHNVSIGECTAIASQTGIAGSTSIGKFSQIGGQVGINGHINIGNKCKIAARSSVTNDVPDNAVFGGPLPAMSIVDWHRCVVKFKNLSKEDKKLPSRPYRKFDKPRNFEQRQDGDGESFGRFPRNDKERRPFRPRENGDRSFQESRNSRDGESFKPRERGDGSNYQDRRREFSPRPKRGTISIDSAIVKTSDNYK
jgi:UDP-3-O-[3-hydroxymyristoyl] glucosamine N-acyltransferase